MSSQSYRHLNSIAHNICDLQRKFSANRKKKIEKFYCSLSNISISASVPAMRSNFHCFYKLLQTSIQFGSICREILFINARRHLLKEKEKTALFLFRGPWTKSMRKNYNGITPTHFNLDWLCQC